MGLGTIMGEVGVVKTVGKRAQTMAAAAATATAMVVVEGVSVGRVEGKREALVILPSGGGGGQEVGGGGGGGGRVEKRKAGKNGNGDGLGDDSSGAAPGVMLNAGPPTLALLIAVLAAVVM